MEERLSQIEARLEALSRALQQVENRLETLESQSEGTTDAPSSPGALQPGVDGSDGGDGGDGGDGTLASEAVPAAVQASATLRAGDTTDAVITHVATLVGRTLVVLGGAYLLRAVSEAGGLSRGPGVTLALTYSLVWMGFAAVAARRGRSLGSTFHATSANLVVLAVTWEATSRFGLFQPWSGALSLALVTALSLALAWRFKLKAVAWITVLGGASTAVLLTIATRSVPPFALYLILSGVATAQLASRRSWPLVGWINAGLADLATAILVFGAALGGATQATAAALVALSLFLFYLASLAVNSLLLQRPMTPFEAVQTTAALVIGWGGGAWVAQVAAWPPGYVLAVVSLPLAAALHALTPPRFDPEHSPTGLYLTGLAVPLVLVGSAQILPHPALVWSALGLVAAGLGVYRRKVYLHLHAILYTLAGALASGLLTYGGLAFFAPADAAWAPPSTAAVLTLAVLLALSLLPPPPPRSPPLPLLHTILKLLSLTSLVWSAAGILVALSVLVASAGGDEAVDPTLLALIRSAVLALTTVLVSWASTWTPWRLASWLVYPIFVGAAFKLVVEDFPHGRPATLFLTLALYGGALITAPRLRRSPR